VRFYENSWMIHHHAASKTESMKAGLEVLKQISHYVNDLHHLSSAHLSFVYCYFRPENKFPNRIFGGFSHQLNDLQGCSLDTFAYFHYRKGAPDACSLPESWALTEIRPQDYAEMNSFYSFCSGGLMMEAFDLHSAPAVPDQLSREYRRLGLKKEKRIYSLLDAGELKAVIISDITDIGFNMANLTNCTTVIVLDETTPRTVLESALACVSEEYEQQEMPVLVYPAAYAGRHSLPVEKSYTLWVMNLQYLDQYFLFCDTFFRSDQKHPTADVNGADNRTCHP